MLLKVKQKTSEVEASIKIGSQLPAILVAGGNQSLTMDILTMLKDNLNTQFDCISLEITKAKELETVMSRMKQRINRYHNHGHVDHSEAIVIENVELLAETTNGLIYLDYLFERVRQARMLLIVRSTATKLTSLLTDLSERCSVRLVSQFKNQRDVELLAQPDEASGLPSDEARTFLIRQREMAPQLVSLEKVGEVK